MGKNLKEYANGKPLKDLKSALLNNEKHPNCDWCWKNEENNLKTHRIKEKRTNGLSSIHIRLNNVCNFKCRMCGPAFSSTWAIENKKHKYFVFEDNEITKDTFQNNSQYLFPLLKKEISRGNLKHLSISGGEPLITDAHFKLLSFLIDNNLTNITLGYSTNLSRLDYAGIDLLSLWKKFDKVSLEASLDGWGPAVEYSRTGFSLKTFKKNFTKAFEYIDTINCVVNIFSVWTLPDIEKFRKYGLNIVYSPCYLPIHTNPQLLMREDKNELVSLYKDYPHLLNIFKNFIDKDLDEGYDMNDYGAKREFYDLNRIRSEMVTFNTMLDKHRDTNFFDTFPMYEKYLRR
jgi:organic radical activating enzyme